MSSTGKIIGALVLYGGGAYGLSRLMRESEAKDKDEAQEPKAQEQAAGENSDTEKESNKDTEQ